MTQLKNTVWQIVSEGSQGFFGNHDSREKRMLFDDKKFTQKLYEPNGKDCNCDSEGTYDISEGKINLHFDDSSGIRELKIIEQKEKTIRLIDSWDMEGNGFFRLDLLD